ncbi:hypothetical protein VTN77DRAFT_7203 [Rasamsonia byssochlamydoides]|uniref:uncharacterized protein n=1 Tax=Rasamsonia byssochlamydoides TaxID=89139 RepID=UPI003743F830
MERPEAIPWDEATWAKYDNDWIRRALWNPWSSYSKFKEEQINRLQGIADRWLSSKPELTAIVQEKIRWIEECTPPGPVYVCNERGFLRQSLRD